VARVGDGQNSCHSHTPQTHAHIQRSATVVLPPHQTPSKLSDSSANHTGSFQRQRSIGSTHVLTLLQKQRGHAVDHKAAQWGLLLWLLLLLLLLLTMITSTNAVDALHEHVHDFFVRNNHSLQIEQRCNARLQPM
jgi:hypothetical protein